MQADDPARAALAESAACGLPVLPQLRLLTVAEALSAPPPRRALELNAELDTLCTALRQGVRRRSGWLYFVPATRPLPAAVPRGLLQAALLCFADGVLALPDGQAAVQLEAAPHAAVLVLRSGRAAAWLSSKPLDALTEVRCIPWRGSARPGVLYTEHLGDGWYAGYACLGWN